MDYIMFVIVIMVLAGLGITIYSFFIKDDADGNYSEKNTDNAINELNNLSKDVFTEFDEKYKELLLLYEMVDEKKKNSTAREKEAVKRAEEKMSVIVNPQLKNILELKNKGMSVAGIAKTLNMGQGEVQLILNLSRK